MSTQDQRERFEAWFSDNGLYPKAIERDKRGYLLSTASTAWGVWQAAEGAAIERCAEVAEAHSAIMATTTAQLIAKNIRALLPKEES